MTRTRRSEMLVKSSLAFVTGRPARGRKTKEDCNEEAAESVQSVCTCRLAKADKKLFKN